LIFFFSVFKYRSVLGDQSFEEFDSIEIPLDAVDSDEHVENVIASNEFYVENYYSMGKSESLSETLPRHGVNI
jgi:hypothetical protein